MAEGYLAEECVTFCSRFLSDAIKTQADQNINVGYSIGSRRNKDGESVELTEKEWTLAHRYVVEVEKLIEYVLIYS